MYKIAVKILLGDGAKYLGLVFGVAFATLLMGQQLSIFIGIMTRTASAIYSVEEADIWVMDKRVRYIEEVEPMRDIELGNIRGVKGVEWAVPFYKGLATIRMPDGLTQQAQLIGVDDVSLAGLCKTNLVGDIKIIRNPKMAVMDINGFLFTWPNEKVAIGKEIELNDNRLTIGAVCDVMPTFYTFPIIYVTYNTAMEITPRIRNRMPFVIVKAKQGENIKEVAKRIGDETGLQSLTREEFAWRSINYILTRTGIAINFGITVFLGMLIGAAITAQTFYIFVIENLKQFAAMKAIGFTNRQLFKVVITQASIVAAIGYSIGIGLTALFFKSTANMAVFKGFILHWQVVAGSAVVICFIILISITISLRRVFRIDPAIVFRG